MLWSEDLLAEVERVLIEDKGLTQQQGVYFCQSIRRTFPAGEIPRKRYEHLIATRLGADPDDHPHSAAAVAGGATILLTSDQRGFPQQDLGSVRAAAPDDYFCEVLEAFPAEVLSVLADMGAQRRQPQQVAQTLTALDRAGLKRFAYEATKRLGDNA